MQGILAFFKEAITQDFFFEPIATYRLCTCVIDDFFHNSQGRWLFTPVAHHASRKHDLKPKNAKKLSYIQH